MHLVGWFIWIEVCVIVSSDDVQVCAQKSVSEEPGASNLRDEEVTAAYSSVTLATTHDMSSWTTSQHLSLHRRHTSASSGLSSSHSKLFSFKEPFVIAVYF
jgi:hypothetical protein